MEGILCGNPAFPREEKALRALIDSHNTARLGALRGLYTLNTKTGKQRDLTFLTNYGDYITTDDTCLCEKNS